MRTLSYWGRRHPWAGRILITVFHLLLAAIALWWGSQLAQHTALDLGFGESLGIGLFIFASALYPIKSAAHRLFRYSYRRQKIMDLALLLSSMLILISVGWEVSIPQTGAQAAGTVQVVPIVHTVKPDGGAKVEQKLAKKEKRSVKKAVRKQIREQLRQLKGQKGVPKGLLFIGVILLAIFLLYLLLGLACSLSCSGSQGLAVLVVVAGLPLLVWGTVVVLRRIQGKGKKVKTT